MDNIDKVAKNSTLNSRQKGNIAESVVCVYLKKRGFEVIARNYLKKCGEIDIIARKNGILHFVEVKSTHYTQKTNGRAVGNVDMSGYNLSENVHTQKQRRLVRTIQLYLIEHRYDPDIEFVIDVAVVTIDMDRRVGRVGFLENVIF